MQSNILAHDPVKFINAEKFKESLYKRFEKLDVLDNHNMHDKIFVDTLRFAQELVDKEEGIMLSISKEGITMSTVLATRDVEIKGKQYLVMLVDLTDTPFGIYEVYIKEHLPSGNLSGVLAVPYQGPYEEEAQEAFESVSEERNYNVWK